jgi:phosphonate transport system permease protein
VVAGVASFRLLEIGFGALLTGEAARSIGEFVAEFFPPDCLAEWLARSAKGIWETLAISVVGTLLAAIAGLLLALPRWRAPFSFLLNTLRSVPELVWATITALAVGLGPFAGALALALHTTGVLGRLYAEALDNAPPAPGRACAWPAHPAAWPSSTAPCPAPRRN